MKRRILAYVSLLLVLGVRAGDCPDVCANAYLWLDASQTDTMSFADGRVTEWRSVNPGGVVARKYTQSAHPCSGPTLAGGLVSFGSTCANRDLGFAKSTAIRSVFMVAKVERSGNAFLLGDNEKFNFHRGGSGEYWHSTHGYAGKNGKTYFNGVEVTNPASTMMPNRLGLIDVQANVGLTASQLCYDRAGNGDVPRRGGKDIAEVLVFTNVLTEAEQKSVRGYLMTKWNLFGVGGAEVVRAHPRLTLGLDKESLVGIKFADGAAGALTNLTVRFDLTNCTPAQIRDIRVWRQKYDPVPFAFFERDAVELTLESERKEGIGNKCGSLTVHFSNSNLVSNTIYPKSGSMAEGDYVWITAKIDEGIATNAEIWASIAGDRVQLSSGDFRLANQTATVPHRPFHYRYQIGAYVRQDRLVGNGWTTSDIFSPNPKERFENLTDVLPIYSAIDGYSNGKFLVGGWSDGDTESTKRLVALRDKYNPGCMIRPSLTPKSWVSANGIYGLAFETAGAAEASRTQYAAAIVEFLEAQHCDGLDIDYEWVRDGTNHREWQNIGKMLRELSEQFFDHGFVLSFAGRSHDSAQSGMPYDAADYGAFHVADYMMMQSYGGGWLNSAPCIHRRTLDVCTKRLLPVRRVVMGQAAYVSADGHPGWDGASYKVEALTSDPLRRFDIDTWWKSPYSSYWPFEGMSSLQAQCLWARRDELGGVMSWGYYTDPTWDGWSSFGRHQSKAIWPMPGAWAEPEKVGEVYQLKAENDWFWLADHPGVKAAFANDITLEHDPLVIDTWTGELDGQGHKLTFAKDTWVVSEKATGLIRNLSGIVRNLTVEMNGRVFTVAARWNDQTANPADVRLMNTTQGENPVGVIAAEAADGAVIENVRVVMGDGSEVKGVKFVGGLVGKVTGAALITNNTVEVGGKIHIEIRNVWDTEFQPLQPFASAICGNVASASAVVEPNVATVLPGGEVEQFDVVPDPAPTQWRDWYEPTWLRGETPTDIDVRSDEFALEVTFRLPQYASMKFGESYPQLIRLVGAQSVALAVSTAGSCELFLTGDGWPNYAYPVSQNAIRGNKDVGTGVPLKTDAEGLATITVENRKGELRVYQDGELLVVTDKNTGGTGYVRSAILGSGVGTLGGGEIVSVRMRIDRENPIVHPGGFGKMIFDEEFGGMALDTNRWEKVPDNARNVAWKQYTSHRDDLVAVSNGCLVLTGVQNDNSDPDETRPYLCGQIQSSGKFNFKYGVIELRAKFEDQNGAWPAMWMMPQSAVHGGWPRSGEIDISERLNKDEKVYQTVHFGETDTTSGGTGAINKDEFNVYRLEWTKHKIVWFVNGVETHSYSDPGTGYLKWPFDSPFYVILSQQLEGGWVNREAATDPSTLPVRMWVDYVRVWQQDDVVSIASAADWTAVDLCTGTARLDADITLDASVTRSDLQGVLNGNGHTIYLSGAPLFTKITGVVSNLNIVVVGDIAGNGSLTDSVEGNGLVQDVSLTVNAGVTITGGRCAGGLVGEVWAGYAEATASVRDCTADIAGTITATSWGRVGGLVGNVNTKDDPAGSTIADNTVTLRATARIVAPAGTIYSGVGGAVGHLNVTSYPVQNTTVLKREGAAIVDNSGGNRAGDVVGGNCWGGTLTQVSGNACFEHMPVTLADDLVWLPIGDSITEGEADMGHPDRGDAASRGGYRYQLWKTLEDRGQQTRSVGYRTGHSGTVEPDDCRWAWHAAQYGGVIMHDNNGSHGAAGFNVENTLEVAGYPDVITVLIGVNDLSFTNGNADPISWVYGTMVKMVTKLSALRPKSRILVSTLLPAGGSRAYIAAYNTLLRNAASAKGAPFDLPNVELADINQEAFGGSFDAANFKGDTLHPNEVGAVLVGKAFAAHVEKIVLDKATNVAEIVSVDNAKEGVVSVRFSKALGDVVSATLDLVGTNVNDEVVSLSLSDCRISGDPRVLDFACTNALAGGVYVARLMDIEATDGNGLALSDELSLDDPQFVEILGTGAEENVPAAYTDGFVRYGTLTVSDGTIDANGIGSGDNFGAYGPGGQFAVENELPEYVRRVGYYVELKRANQPPQFVWVSMDAANGFNKLSSKIGIPTAASGNLKAVVSNLQVYGNRGNFTNSTLDENGDSADTGIVEFTPWNWTAGDQSGFPQDFNANGFGWNDTLASGYLKGGMQIAKILRTADFDNYTKVGAEMLFAYNNFNRESPTDFAIGSFSTHRNNAGASITVVQDWGDFIAITDYKKFAVNAYEVKKIEIWAVPDPDYVPPNWTHFTTSTSSSPTWTAPDDGKWTSAGSCAIATKPIGFTVGSGASTLTINLIATLPANTSGAMAGWKVGDNTVQLVYNHANNRFDVTYNGTTTHPNTTRHEPADVTKPHVYTISITPVGVGTFVYQDGNLIVNAPGVKWNGTTLNTTYTIGSAVGGSQPLSGMIVQAADYNFSAAANNYDRIFSGYDEFPVGMPMSFALKVITEATDADGNLALPPIKMNGKALSGREALSAIWLFGGDFDKATNFNFGLSAPVVENGLVGLSLGADDPVNAALRLLTAKNPSGPWLTAAEIAPGTSGRAFVFAADDKSSFYHLSAVSAMTPAAAQGMPVSLDSASRVSLGNMTITSDDLARGTIEVQLAGAGVAEGMVASLLVDGVALVAHATAEGKLMFDLSILPDLQTSKTQNIQTSLDLYTAPGSTNGDIRVSSPAVSGLTYSPAVLTAMVADGLKTDGFSTISFGQYRIPAIASDGQGEVVACYDIRYGGGDLGTGDGIDIGESYSADAGKSFDNPRMAVDVPNTCDENQVSHGFAKTNDLGDVALLYDPDEEAYWMMGMTGKGLSGGDYSMNDVVLYRRGKGRKAPWTFVRSVKDEVAVQKGIANGNGGYGFGFLQGPGHGFVTKIGTDEMPAGTLVFPMQYFVDSSFTASSAGAVYSTDHGQTWTATHRTTTANGPQENCVMELDDGSWYMTCKAGYRKNNYAETGRFQFFRTKDFVEWTYVDERFPVPCQQGSCLRLGKNSSGVGQYVYCHTLDRQAGVRSQLALVFGSDTTHGESADAQPSTTNKGVAWDSSSTLMLYAGDTGFKGYNSLCMVDAKTLGVLYEAQGRIYFVRIDVSDRLK